MSSSIRAVSVAVGLVFALAGVAWLASANEAHLRFLLAKPRLTSDIFPMGIRDLVTTSDAIVRARQVSLAFAGYLQEYDYETGQPIWVDPDAPTADGLPVIMVGPVTDVTILVLE